MAEPRIAIIDEEPGQPLGGRLQAILERERSYRVELIGGLLSDGNGLEPRPDLIIPLLPASAERTTDAVAVLRAKAAGTPVLPVLRAEDLRGQLEILPWTTDFLATPLRAAEVCARVRRVLFRSREAERVGGHEAGTEPAPLEGFIGEDPAFVVAKRKLPLLAQCEAPVLLTGETGTGKELCARALHYLSRRTGKPFLPVNCGAIPVELFESELFGHRKGAFTSAWAAQPGLIAEAEGGTLFLDEIETLSLGAQAKLLRFLEDRTYHALGSSRPSQADVWIVASTNEDLSRKVRDGTFRKDLFYRLAVLTLTLPPLRERRGDIPRLVAYFWTRYGDQHGGERKRLSPRALEALCQYHWPGNVRELQNVIQQVVLLAEAPTIEPEDLPIPSATLPMQSPGTSLKEAKAHVIAQFEKAYLSGLLLAHHGNVTQAARAAQTERRALGRLIKKYHLAKH